MIAWGIAPGNIMYNQLQAFSLVQMVYLSLMPMRERRQMPVRGFSNILK